MTPEDTASRRTHPVKGRPLTGRSPSSLAPCTAHSPGAWGVGNGTPQWLDWSCCGCPLARRLPRSTHGYGDQGSLRPGQASESTSSSPWKIVPGISPRYRWCPSGIAAGCSQGWSVPLGIRSPRSQPRYPAQAPSPIPPLPSSRVPSHFASAERPGCTRSAGAGQTQSSPSGR